MEQEKSNFNIPTPEANGSQPVATEPVVPAQSVTPSEPAKKSNIPLIITIIISVVAVIAAVVFAVLYFNQPRQNANNSGASQGQENTESSSDASEISDAETEVTDVYILRDLNEKIALLHNVTANSSELNAYLLMGGYYGMLDVYTESGLNEAAKVSQIIRNYFSDSDFRYIDFDERESVIKELGYVGDSATEVRQHLNSGIDGDLVAKKYLDVFGSELNRESFNSCYYYQYNAEHDFYFQDPVGGCGGASPYYRYYYQYKVTTSGDYAYVYAKAAVADAETGNVYCGVYLLDELRGDGLSVCETVDDMSDFTINESNYEKYQTYRFVFKKADDGSYYFVRTEKI